MATSNNPLAPDPIIDIDGPEVFPPIDPDRETLEDDYDELPIEQEDLGAPVPVGEEGNIEVDEDDALFAEETERKKG